MRSVIRKSKSPEGPVPVAEPEPPAAPVVVDEAAAAECARTEASQAREEASQARREAAVVVEAARAEAQRIVAAAEEQARTLTAESGAADRHATQLEEQASYLAHAHALRGQAADAEQQALDLTTEAGDLAVQVDALTGRLEGFGEQREDTTTALTTARESGDVAAVTRLRAELAAVDEVVGVLAGQRDALLARLRAIGGPDDPGELGTALQAAQAAHTELRRVRNVLDPARPEALVDQLLDTLTGVVEARVAEINAAREAAGKTRRPVQAYRRPDGTLFAPLPPRQSS